PFSWLGQSTLLVVPDRPKSRSRWPYAPPPLHVDARPCSRIFRLRPNSGLHSGWRATWAPDWTETSLKIFPHLRVLHPPPACVGRPPARVLSADAAPPDTTAPPSPGQTPVPLPFADTPANPDL